MSVTVIGKLTGEDLADYRLTAARLEAAQTALPSVTYTKEEVEDIYIAHWRTVEEILGGYDLTEEEMEEAKISVFTGQIYLGAEE